MTLLHHAARGDLVGVERRVQSGLRLSSSDDANR